MTIADRFEGCIIGDAYGSAYENNVQNNNDDIYYPFGKPPQPTPLWQITDDTQLTLATCEVLIESKDLTPEKFAAKYLSYYNQRKITGLGSATLKAMRELQLGAHWNTVGRKGEYAAGNGAAMRIAPLAFNTNIDRTFIKNVCNITHHNDEAYVGALAIIISIRAIINGEWNGNNNIIPLIIDKIPDTRVRDRFIKINSLNDDWDRIVALGNDGYVVNSIPLAITFANQIKSMGINAMYEQLIKIGGDTDTNCAIAGQIAGTLLGVHKIPNTLKNKLKELREYPWIQTTIEQYKLKVFNSTY